MYIVASDDSCCLRILSGEEGKPTFWEGERWAFCNSLRLRRAGLPFGIGKLEIPDE